VVRGASGDEWGNSLGGQGYNRLHSRSAIDRPNIATFKPLRRCYINSELINFLSLSTHFFWGGGDCTKLEVLCERHFLKQDDFMFNFPIKASFSLWWPEVLYQARNTTPSLLLFVVSSWCFFVGSQSFNWKCWKMMSISSTLYSCSCYKPSLFIRHHRCSLNIKNNSESSENVYSTDTELPHIYVFFTAI
jgi:hypothetical protein